MLGLLLAALAAPLLHVDPARDAGLPCAAHASLRARLETLDPGAQRVDPPGQPGAPGEGEPLEARLSPERDGWALELARADGTAALARSLKLSGDAAGCALAAESAALIVDRYLAALRDPSRQPGSGQAGLRQARAASATVAEAPAQAAIEGRRGAPVSETPREAAARAKAERARGDAKKIANANPARASVSRDADAARGPATASTTGPAAASSPAASPAMTNGSAAGSRSYASSGAPASPAPRVASALPVAPGETPREDPLRPASPGATEPARDELQPAQLTLSAGPGALLGGAADLRFAFWIEAEHPLSFFSTAFSARMLLISTSASAQSEYIDGNPRGRLSAQSFLLALSAGPCFELWARACASGFAGTRATLGSAGGEGLYRTSNAWLLQPELGAQLSLSRPLTSRLSLSLELLAGAVPGSGQLSVEGGPARALPAIDTSAALLVDYQLF